MGSIKCRRKLVRAISRLRQKAAEVRCGRNGRQQHGGPWKRCNVRSLRDFPNDLALGVALMRRHPADIVVTSRSNLHRTPLALRPYPLTRTSVSPTCHTSYRSYATFSDPDGNGWLLQEVTT